MVIRILICHVIKNLPNYDISIQCDHYTQYIIIGKIRKNERLDSVL